MLKILVLTIGLLFLTVSISLVIGIVENLIEWYKRRNKDNGQED